MPIKKVGSFAIRTAKNTIIGGAGGYLAGGFVGPAHYKEDSAKQGALVGALAGGVGSVGAGVVALGGGKLMRGAYGGLLKLSKKVGRKPNFDEGKLVRAVASGVRKGRITFRRIRGRLVPIRAK